MHSQPPCDLIGGLQGGNSLTEKILVERDRIVSDIAHVKNGLAELELMVATRRITRQRAELVSAQCNDELRRLTVRLADLDASISIARATPKTVRER